MGNEVELGPEGISRREALKRGLKLTGAVMWATPVVQAIGMRPAFAQTVSPTDPCIDEECFRAKANYDGDLDAFVFEARPGFGANDCNDCGGDSGADGSNLFTITITDTNDDGEPIAVTIALTSDDCRITSASAKGGGAGGYCATGIVSADGQSATVARPAGEQAAISHVEICFCCCADD